MSSDGVQKIIGEIEKNAEKIVSEILSEAKEKTDAVLNDAQREADDQVGTIVSRGEQEARREAQRILAEARIKARREKANAQEDMVRKSFNIAQEKLSTIARERKADGIDYINVIEGLIKEAVLASGVKSLEVVLAMNDRDVISQEILRGTVKAIEAELRDSIDLRISEETLSCKGGVVVRSIDGKVRVDNTFESRIERFRETIRTSVAKELFGQEL